MAFSDDRRDFWEKFGEDYNSSDRKEFGETYSLAVEVLKAYGLESSEVTGGALPDLDIKHMDAMQLIKLSLLEQTAKDGSSGKLYEPMIDANDGKVIFQKVGGTSFNPRDVYYEIQSSSYVEDCSGVLVTGKDPLAKRKEVTDDDWRPIWGEEDEGGKKIYDMGRMHKNCAKEKFNQYCTIIYNDPHLSDNTRDNGIDNIYEITSDNPWESIIGYCHMITWPGWREDRNTIIGTSDTANVLIQLKDTPESQTLTNLGKLMKRPLMTVDGLTNPGCSDDPDSDDAAIYADGVSITIPEKWQYETVRHVKEDKFAGVTGVYIVGRKIDDLRGKPTTDADGIKDPNSEGEGPEFSAWAYINKLYDEVISLEEGKHYQLAVDQSDPTSLKYSIVFADNSRPTDKIKFGDGNIATEIDVYIDPDCEFYRASGGTGPEVQSMLVLPTDLTKGIWVKEVWVGITLNTPSVTIYHPDGTNGKAREIAESLEYRVLPLIIEDKPAPIAFNGEIVRQEDSLADHDPTTKQNFKDTELEKVYDQMDKGGGMTLTLSFLDELQTKNLSEALYEYMKAGSGVETTYVCGPNEDEVILGSSGPGGENSIVNSIVYSYQDSSSYTISVNCGPTLVGGALAEIQGGPSLKATETVSGKGTIIQDEGNGMYYKVRIDGIGDRIAVSMVPKVLRVGDKVNVTIHNNPVEA